MLFSTRYSGPDPELDRPDGQVWKGWEAQDLLELFDIHSSVLYVVTRKPQQDKTLSI